MPAVSPCSSEASATASPPWRERKKGRSKRWKLPKSWLPCSRFSYLISAVWAVQEQFEHSWSHTLCHMTPRDTSSPKPCLLSNEYYYQQNRHRRLFCSFPLTSWVRTRFFRGGSLSHSKLQKVKLCFAISSLSSNVVNKIFSERSMIDEFVCAGFKYESFDWQLTLLSWCSTPGGGFLSVNPAGLPMEPPFWKQQHSTTGKCVVCFVRCTAERTSEKLWTEIKL